MAKIGKITFAERMRIRRALVQDKLDAFAKDLNVRGRTHDNSAFGSPEAEYGRDWYEHPITDTGIPPKDMEENFRYYQNHHHLHNDHHPEHFVNGIDDMHLGQILEWRFDERSACEQEQRDIYEMMKLLAVKYNISNQLYGILLNTIREMRYLKR